MVTLGEALGEGKCGLKPLKLSKNNIRDEGIRILCSVLEQGTCRLTQLDVSKCSLTDECMPILCKALGDERRKLTDVDANNDGFTDKHLSLRADTLKLQSFCLKHLRIPFSITEAGKKILDETRQSDFCKKRGSHIFYAPS